MRKKILLITPPAIIVIGIICTMAWLYSGTLTDAKAKVFTVIPLPAAMINNNLVSTAELIERIDLAKKIPPETADQSELTNSEVFDQFIDSIKLETIAARENVKVTREQIDAEYRNIISQYAEGDEDKFSEALVKTYQLSPDEFKEQVLRLITLRNNLESWYNSQESHNQQAYKTLKDFQAKLDQGENFEDLALAYTQDEATRDFAGDTGFVILNELLPEFQEALEDANQNDIKTIASSNGLHLIKVLEKDVNEQNETRLHLQQIYIELDGFDTWYQQQAKNIPVRKLIEV